MQTKATIRQTMLAQRGNMNPVEKSAMDRALCNRLQQIADQMGAETIHCYLPMTHEIDLWPAIKHWLQNGQRVVCPKVKAPGTLEHLILHSPEKLETGTFNTHYPAGNVQYYGTYDLIVVPGLAFDLKNHRIGYGKGYYDRFLKHHASAYKVAPAYHFQMLESLPVEDHDVFLDRVLIL